MEYPVDGRMVKRSLNAFLVGYRRSFPQKYFWFLEFQKRGAPHVHIFSQVRNPSDGHRARAADLWLSAQKLSLIQDRKFTRLSDGKELNLPYTVYEQHIRPKVWESFRSEDGAIRYAAKYALKTYQKEVPKAYRNVGRFWGASRFTELKQPDYVVVGIKEQDVRDLAARFLGREFDMDYLPRFLFGEPGRDENIS
jgi:hypothetical protein